MWPTTGAGTVLPAASSPRARASGTHHAPLTNGPSNASAAAVPYGTANRFGTGGTGGVLAEARPEVRTAASRFW